MSNPDNGNRPPQQGDGGSIWNNYFGLLPYLGLAAYRYFWVKHTEREIEKIKEKYEMDLVKKDQTLNMKDQEQTVLVALKKVEHKLKERQYVYCSPFAFRKRRLEIEDDLHQMSKNPIFARLNMAYELNDIFRNDHHCAPERFNRNDELNGKLMWVYMNQWEKKLMPEKAEADVLGNIKTFFKMNP
ncbi:coiled-coil domain-containing protein 127-like [Triplophysa dalaica]|uniref:coiled-coil domain-containing protein 127-like n=1 Tax=Triplophysa dalaica TaxID=1582913 RepID=UPI0024DF3796|nr:coiled-coil domain-containing protein 127-like [Triplophysa dalaica]